MMTINTLVFIPLKEMFHTVVGFIPTLFVAFLILLLGYLSAKLLRDLFQRLLEELHFDRVVDKLGLSRLFHAGKIKHRLSHLLGGMLYLIVIVMFLIVTMKALGIETMSRLMTGLTAYLSPVLSALFVLVLGLILAKIVGQVIYLTGSRLQLPNPKLQERVSRWAIVLYAAKLSLMELGYGFLFSGMTFHILFGGLVLALALAFGLGGRDMAAGYLSRKK